MRGRCELFATRNSGRGEWSGALRGEGRVEGVGMGMGMMVMMTMMR